MTEHTPGPWRIEGAEDAYGNATISPDNGMEYHDEECVATVYLDGTPTSEANARLIAAAPAMLEALTLALDALYDYGDSSVVAQVEAVIALARGTAEVSA